MKIHLKHRDPPRFRAIEKLFRAKCLCGKTHRQYADYVRCANTARKDSR